MRVSSAAAGVWSLRAAGVDWGTADGVTAGLLPYSRSRLLRVEQDGRFVLEDEGGSEREYLFKEVQYIL